MGLFSNLFFKTWLVQAFNVRGAEFHGPVVKHFIQAHSKEDAEEKLRRYLIEENFAFGRIEASFG